LGPIDPEAALKLQPEMLSGESLLWAGRPNPDIIFSAGDWVYIPFSFLWVAFTTFWEAGALGYWGNSAKNGPSLFMALWGIPFILIGQYMLWGRYVYDGWLKRRTYYGVTSRRILIVQEGWNRKATANYIDVLPTIDKEGSQTGTIWFGPKLPVVARRGQSTQNMSRFKLGSTPAFVDIDDVASVAGLVVDLREQLSRKETTFSR
jgi:hypothetical protein